jgi:predicted DNA-binding protein (MmcQ/YjbR family)
MNIEDFRSYCLSLPGTTEMIQWGADLLFKVGDKAYVFMSMAPPHGFSIKCSDDEFHEMISRDGIEPAAYLGRFKWVRVSSLDRLSDAETKLVVKKSYDHIVRKLPKRLRDALG